MEGQIKIVHLELNDGTGASKHEYYGSLKALCENHGKEDIGITYGSLRNVISEGKPYQNKKCIIRLGWLIRQKSNEKNN